METIRFAADGSSRWAGMGDYRLVSPNGKHTLSVRYAGEPPHGDSFHELLVDGRKFPGWVWGDYFAFSETSRYFVASWMAQKYERRTIVIDLDRREYCQLPSYLTGKLSVRWPLLSAEQQGAATHHLVAGQETWIAF